MRGCVSSVQSPHLSCTHHPLSPDAVILTRLSEQSGKELKKQTLEQLAVSIHYSYCLYLKRRLEVPNTIDQWAPPTYSDYNFIATVLNYSRPSLSGPL